MDRVIDKITRRFTEIVPTEQTFFLCVDKPGIKNFNKKLIMLNYSLLSPFIKTDLMFYVDKKKLYIWFVKEKLSAGKIYIPEGFLLFKSFKNAQNVIVIKENNSNTTFIVIKNGMLAAQTIKNKETDQDEFIELLKKEHSLKESETVRVESSKTLSININDSIKFLLSQLELDFSSIMQNVYEQSKLPVITLLVILNIADFSYYIYSNSLLNSRKKVFVTLEQKNNLIKTEFEKLEFQKKFWSNFRANELKYPNVYTTLNIISKIIAGHNGYIKTISRKGNIVDMWVVSDSSSNLVNDLTKSGYFTNIQILSINQISRINQRNNEEVAHIEAKIKEKI